MWLVPPHLQVVDLRINNPPTISTSLYICRQQKMKPRLPHPHPNINISPSYKCEIITAGYQQIFSVPPHPISSGIYCSASTTALKTQSKTPTQTEKTPRGSGGVAACTLQGEATFSAQLYCKPIGCHGCCCSFVLHVSTQYGHHIQPQLRIF